MDTSPLPFHGRWDGMSAHRLQMDYAHHIAIGVHLQDSYHRPGIKAKKKEKLTLSTVRKNM
jgi:hypothetical protein